MTIGVFFINLVSSFLLFIFSIFSWHNFMKKKIDFKNYKFYLCLGIGVIISVLINLFLPKTVKLLLIIVLLFLLSYIFYCRDITKALVMSIVPEMIAVICECILASLILLFVGNDTHNLSESFIGLLIISVGVPILGLLTLKTPYPAKIYNYLVRTFNNMKQSSLIVYFIATVFLISLFLIMTYMELPTTFVLISNTLLTILYVIIIVKLANISEDFKIVNGKYETSLSSLKESETIIDQHRIDNHENKNQLLIIRNMVKANDKNTVKYIDALIDNKINDNENIFYKTSKIPEGGLRFTIYSKLCKMKDMGIEYSLEIANDVSAADLINMDDNTMLNICKIIGVFLDNAIEAVEELDEKDIIVEIFIMDNQLCIEISNNYKEAINLDKIANKGYSTKGKGHGYGLTLVSELLKIDSNLENEKEINKDLFTQRLKIKM